MTTARRNLLEALASATRTGIACGVAFFVLGMSAAFLVTGDGHASRFTYFMIALIDVPINLFGLERQGTIFPASAFWGVVSGLGMFVYRFLRPSIDREGV